MNKLISGWLVAGLTLGLTPIGSVVAQGANQTTSDTMLSQEMQSRRAVLREQIKTELREELTTERQQRITDRCETIRGRVDQQLDKIAGIREARGTMVANLAQRLQTFGASASERGVDVTALTADLATLTELVDELDTLWTTYTDASATLRVAGCSETADDYHAALEVVKAAFSDLRAQYQTIKDFVLSDIKPDLRDIRDQLAALVDDQRATDEATN
jgi:hypothetical protein